MRVCRILTAPIRVLPDFIIIGAQRAGTTSLFEYVSHHPCIGCSFGKELHFFDNLKGSFQKGLMWYRAHFPSYPYMYLAKKVRGRDMITGEASPYYLFHPLAATRIARVLPRVKLIAILRNPVDRAYSHYHHNAKYKRETLSFEAALEKDRKDWRARSRGSLVTRTTVVRITGTRRTWPAVCTSISWRTGSACLPASRC